MAKLVFFSRFPRVKLIAIINRNKIRIPSETHKMSRKELAKSCIRHFKSDIFEDWMSDPRSKYVESFSLMERQKLVSLVDKMNVPLPFGCKSASELDRWWLALVCRSYYGSGEYDWSTGKGAK